jgi:hypothetical protein
MPRGPLAFNLRPAARRRRAGHVDQILDRAHARNPLRRRLQPVDLLLPVYDPSKEHGAVLGVDAHVFVRHAGTAVELAFDRARERLRRRAAPGAGGERSRCAERSRPRVLSAPRAHQGSALSAAHPRQPTVAHFVAGRRPPLGSRTYSASIPTATPHATAMAGNHRARRIASAREWTGRRTACEQL